MSVQGRVPCSWTPGAAKRALLLCSSIVWFLALACRTESAAPSPIRVAAAADLGDAFEELGRVFEAQGGQQVTFSFGSTGLLAKQLALGAPFDLFAAANGSFVDEVVAAGACDGTTQQPYARGRIAVWTRRDHVRPPRSLDELADERFGRIAIASPDHAPYGRAAREALRSAGLWSTVEPRLVVGENVRQALQFAETGNVDVAIVALALVVTDDENPWMLVDERHHGRLEQALVVCERGSNRSGGRAFARFVGSDGGRAVMRRYGFVMPDEGLEGRP